MRPSFSNPSRAVGPICHARRENGVGRPAIRVPIRTIFPSSSPATGRARPSTPFCRRSPAPPSARRWPDRHAGQSPRRRRRPADRRLRPPRRHSLPRRALAGQANSRGAPPPHQQCQRLPQPPQAMAQPLQRRRHQKPAKLPRLAQSPRSLGPTPRPAKMDPQRHRKRTIPTDNAIRAQLSPAPSSLPRAAGRRGRERPDTRRRAVERLSWAPSPWRRAPAR